jgi:hypothetical protein
MYIYIHICTHMNVRTYLNIVEEVRVDELESHDASSEDEHVAVGHKVPDALPNDLVHVVNLFVCVCVCVNMCSCGCVCVYACSVSLT